MKSAVETWWKQFATANFMSVFRAVFEIVSELFLFVIMPLFATVAAVWTFWNVLAAIDPNEVKSIQSFLTVIVVVVPFVMLVFYGLAVVMYDQLMKRLSISA